MYINFILFLFFSVQQNISSGVSFITEDGIFMHSLILCYYVVVCGLGYIDGGVGGGGLVDWSDVALCAECVEKNKYYILIS